MEKLAEAQIHDQEMKWGMVRSNIHNRVGRWKYNWMPGIKKTT